MHNNHFDNNFQLSHIFKQAWQLTKKNFWMMFGIGVISIIIDYVFSVSEKYTPSMVYFLLSVVSYIVGTLLSFNISKMVLDMIDAKKIEIMDMFKWDQNVSSRIVPYFFATIIYTLMILVGLIFLIVPGIYLAIKYQYVRYLLIENDMSIQDAFKKSGDMTKGNMWNLLVLGLASAGIAILGVCALIVGIIPAIMVATFATFLVYRKLGSKRHTDHTHQA